jgi:hypothetical protein
MGILSRRRPEPKSARWLNALIADWERFLAGLAEHYSGGASNHRADGKLSESHNGQEEELSEMPPTSQNAGMVRVAPK